MHGHLHSLFSLCGYETLYGETQAQNTSTHTYSQAQNSHILTTGFPHDSHIVIRSEVYTDSFIDTVVHFAS